MSWTKSDEDIKKDLDEMMGKTDKCEKCPNKIIYKSELLCAFHCNFYCKKEGE